MYKADLFNLFKAILMLSVISSIFIVILHKPNENVIEVDMDYHFRWPKVE